ncbi:MAG: acylphosphatase [Anaerolineae bacterium]|nr:acylphosphatase [Gemmatimonadaceae bacterium]
MKRLSHSLWRPFYAGARNEVGVLHLVIRGSVQGVGFRYFTRSTAQRCGVAGWVRNRDDGAVEIAASGSDQALESFLAIVQRGPSGSRIDGVEHLPAGSAGEFGSTFSVRR